jgi:hypothetical protein
MKTNVGGVERLIRIFAGVTLLFLTFTSQVGSWGYAGVVLIATGMVGICPPYALLGFSTCKKTESDLH